MVPFQIRKLHSAAREEDDGNDELKTTLKEMAVTCCKAFGRHLFAVIKENHEICLSLYLVS
jgi:hypothetical protein